MIDTTGLHPELAAIAPHLPDLALDDPVAARAAGRALVEQASAGAPPLDLSGVVCEEIEVAAPDGPVAVTVYRPVGVDKPAAVINIHGGGFVMGDRESIEAQCVSWTRELGIAVVNPDYGLAPERPCPGALEDCYATLRWADDRANGFDVDRLAVAGSSAGACIAAGVALMARDRGGPSLAFQMLGCPVTDDRATTESAMRFTDTPVWNRAKVVQSWNLYAGNDRRHLGSYGAPARVDDLSGLPPSFVLVAGLDPLRDEGIAYAQRMIDAGVPTELHVAPDVCHGFTSLPGSRSAHFAAVQTTALARALA
ncbi:alpha/beta hydrolase [Gordonia alkanivorans]|uniref:Esterase n=1 Tax=Gordonia alkanivorans CGMCC 6845 TaxID=1423140 RepID=W9D8J8_9ACTN|nr:alpha/beta hydrolase [Gordonia alkanivorans]ETA04644.1 esterase [Gordonia alkanivorans CGMCC 6845]MDH3046770.1 alpha/beta hydrolase [Gordonia alkanivorans]